MSFPREEVEATIWRLLAQELLEVVCEHTGRTWQAMSREERADALSSHHPRMERATKALAAVAQHAYERGVATTHSAMVAVDADPFAIDDAVARAMTPEEP